MSRLEPQTERARLDAALAERDAALEELASARAELEALRLRLISAGEPTPPNYPASAAPGAPPLRYVLVDELHGAVKGVLGRLTGKGRQVDE